MGRWDERWEAKQKDALRAAVLEHGMTQAAARRAAAAGELEHQGDVLPAFDMPQSTLRDLIKRGRIARDGKEVPAEILDDPAAAAQHDIADAIGQLREELHASRKIPAGKRDIPRILAIVKALREADAGARGIAPRTRPDHDAKRRNADTTPAAATDSPLTDRLVADMHETQRGTTGTSVHTPAIAAPYDPPPADGDSVPARTPRQAEQNAHDDDAGSCAPAGDVLPPGGDAARGLATAVGLPVPAWAPARGAVPDHQ